LLQLENSHHHLVNWYHNHFRQHLMVGEDDVSDEGELMAIEMRV
jgi:hypothetical protein